MQIFCLSESRLLLPAYLSGRPGTTKAGASRTSHAIGRKHNVQAQGTEGLHFFLSLLFSLPGLLIFPVLAWHLLRALPMCAERAEVCRSALFLLFPVEVEKARYVAMSSARTVRFSFPLASTCLRFSACFRAAAGLVWTTFGASLFSCHSLESLLHSSVLISCSPVCALTRAAIKPLFVILRRWPEDALARFAEACRAHWVYRFSSAFSLSSGSRTPPCCPRGLSPSPSALGFSFETSPSSSFALVVERLSALVRERAETELELRKEFSHHPSLKKARDEVCRLRPSLRLRAMAQWPHSPLRGLVTKPPPLLPHLRTYTSS